MSKLLKRAPVMARGFAAWSRAHYAPSHSSLSDGNVGMRLQQLRERLKIENRLPVVEKTFQLSPKGKIFIREVSESNLNKKYSRGGRSGEGFVGIDELIRAAKSNYYTEDERVALIESSKKLQERMRVKVSDSYMRHALEVPENALELSPILKVVMPETSELDNLDGEIDPSKQNSFSPLPGLLHKYEMLLALVSINCSSHCRYCYRLDLFNGSSNKSKADMALIAAYIKTFNELIDDAIKENGVHDTKFGGFVHKETREPFIHVREILFSGGDPMTLPNATIARYMALMAEAGIKTIRIGTKELVFNPSRFDENFWKMMDLFHKTYPEMTLDIVGHYVHPYELMKAKTDKVGRYIYSLDESYKLREDVEMPLQAIKQRSWIGHYNQFPIIAGVNDRPEILSLLMHQMRVLGISTHNIYACREIVGNAHFRKDNTIDAQYELVEEAKVRLSGVENHGRLIMSTEYGKLEVVGIEGKNVLLKVNRFIHGKRPKETIIAVDLSKLPDGEKFYWLTDKVVKNAVSETGKEVLKEIKNETSFIKSLKDVAAQIVTNSTPQNDNQKPCETKSCGKVSIEITNPRNGATKTIYVDLSESSSDEKVPTLATVLKENDEIEMVCDGQLSCSTCVAEVEANPELPRPSEDELDVIDMAGFQRSPSKSIRATCQIKLREGDQYRVTSSKV